VARRHGGSIEVGDGRGAVFVVDLPNTLQPTLA